MVWGLIELQSSLLSGGLYCGFFQRSTIGVILGDTGSSDTSSYGLGLLNTTVLHSTHSCHDMADTGSIETGSMLYPRSLKFHTLNLKP